MKRMYMMVMVLMLIAGCGHVDNRTTSDDEEGEGNIAWAGLSGGDRSAWDAALPKGSHAIVVAANWTDPIGSLASIDLASPGVAQTALITTDSSDAVLQSFGGMIFVINRYGTDTIQVIDPAAFSVVGNYSVGGGSNPQDIYVHSSEKAYITRLDAHNDAANTDDVLIVNPVSGELVGSIDLKPYTADDGDRLARATQMVAVGNALFILMQDLPSNLLNPADAPGTVAVIDMTSD